MKWNVPARIIEIKENEVILECVEHVEGCDALVVHRKMGREIIEHLDIELGMILEIRITTGNGSMTFEIRPGNLKYDQTVFESSEFPSWDKFWSTKQ